MPRRGRPGSKDDEALFRRAMRDVEPLADEGRSRLPRRKRHRPAAAGAARQPRFAGFELERWGEQVEGRAERVGSVELSRLRGGKIPVDLTVDLHHLDEEAARSQVHAALARLRRGRGRCLRVIHGRGLCSPGRPVLKDSLPDWLAEAPHRAAILAFVTAPPELGGAGAMLVLLRRQG